MCVQGSVYEASVHVCTGFTVRGLCACVYRVHCMRPLCMCVQGSLHEASVHMCVQGSLHEASVHVCTGFTA